MWCIERVRTGTFDALAHGGGLVVLGEAGRATFQDLGSLGGNDAPAYAFPFGTHSPWRGLALFHLHAVDADGDPREEREVEEAAVGERLGRLDHRQAG